MELLHVLSTRAVEPMRWLVVAGIAYTLATTALYFFSPPQSDSTMQGQVVSKRTPSQPANINDILSRNLFGVADASVQPSTSTAPAVETRLPLELHGVFVAEAPEDSAAIVAQKGKPGKLYEIGKMLPGNAELLEVYADHIVLRRAGVRESLKFPEASGQFVANTPDDQAAVNEVSSDVDGDDSEVVQAAESSSDESTPNDNERQNPASTAREFVAHYRERIEADPEGTLSELGIAPVTEGAPSGYRLGNLADSPYLSQTGLQPGDVILSVNGRPVGDVGQDKMELENVLAQGSARLEVQRGTRRFFVTASLK